MNNLQRSSSIEDSETWFYGVREQIENKDQIENKEIENKGVVSNKLMTLNSNYGFPKEQKLKRSLFEDSLDCFMIYKRQYDALLKCAQEGPMARVFTFEYSTYHPGHRRYLVSTLKRFWQWYKKQYDVSFYELIPQNRPARLYFDLEFYRKTNPDIKEEVLIKNFNDCVTEVFAEMFNIDLDPEKQMLVLDASTITKFSEHIIIHLFDNHLFPSNISMKFFIQQLKEKMLSSGRCLVWNADATKLTTLFDATVYSVNRNFRLYLSSKMGKNNPLVLAQRCNFYINKKHPSKRQIFLDSLVVPAKYNTPKIFYISIAENGEHPNIQKKSKILAFPTQVLSSNDSVDYMIGYGATSPFPVLDQHIISINRKWKDNASIRCWKLSADKFATSRHIIYYILNCRYCFNIGREHRSNGVYWIVNLDKLHCFQKCFDIDCNGISSNYFPLPDFVCTSLLSAKITAPVNLALKTNKIANKMVESDNISREALLDLIREARVINETQVQRRALTSHQQNVIPEMQVLQNSRNLFELTDDELLNAFDSVKT